MTISKADFEQAKEEAADQVRDAQQRLLEAIQRLEEALDTLRGAGMDAIADTADTYLVAQLKTSATNESGYLSRDLNMDRMLTDIDDANYEDCVDEDDREEESEQDQEGEETQEEAKEPEKASDEEFDLINRMENEARG